MIESVPECDATLAEESAALKKMPVLFVGHGSPMNAIEHNAFTETLQGLSARLPKPQGGVRGVGALGDRRARTCWRRPIRGRFMISMGFPAALYEVQYPAPGAPSEAERLAKQSGD